jgi:hypothetical protein
MISTHSSQKIIAFSEPKEGFLPSNAFCKVVIPKRLAQYFFETIPEAFEGTN